MKLTRRAFKKWLKKQKGTVGYANNSFGCPIACFLRQTGTPDAKVGLVSYWPSEKPTAPGQHLDQWARAFIARIDTLYRYEPIGADVALKILDEI